MHSCLLSMFIFIFKQKTAYELRISDWSSDVCSSDLKEKFFQPVDKEASDFTLRNAGGETVRLVDLRGKVVVLHFIYAGCPDVCPLHAEKIAEIQEMEIGRASCRERVCQYV